MKKLFLYLSGLFFLVCCCAVIGWHSLAVVFDSQRDQLHRSMVNRRLRKGSKQLFRLVDSDYRLNYAAEDRVHIKRPTIYMSNHLSLFDLPLIYATMPGTIRIVGKKEIFNIPLFGKALFDAENLCIDQQHPEEMLNFYHDAKKILSNGIALWIFPEGSRSLNGVLGKFSQGGFQLAREVGAEIIPVGITGTYELLPSHSFFLRRGQSLRISVGAPIDSRLFTGIEGQKDLVAKVRTSILELSEKGQKL